MKHESPHREGKTPNSAEACGRASGARRKRLFKKLLERGSLQAGSPHKLVWLGLDLLFCFSSRLATGAGVHCLRRTPFRYEVTWAGQGRGGHSLKTKRKGPGWVLEGLWTNTI